MRFIKYSLFLISSLLCGVLTLTALALSMAITQGIPLPAIDGSNQYIYYPPNTANFSGIVSIISTAIPILIISFIPSKKRKLSNLGCLGKFFFGGFKFLFLFSVVYLANVIFGLNGFLLFFYSLGQIYGHPMPLKPEFGQGTQMPFSTSENVLVMMLVGSVLMLIPFVILLGTLFVFKLIAILGDSISSYGNSPYRSSRSSSSTSSDSSNDWSNEDRWNPNREKFERKWKEKEEREQQEQWDQESLQREQDHQEKIEREQQNWIAEQEANDSWRQQHEENEEFNRQYWDNWQRQQDEKNNE